MKQFILTKKIAKHGNAQRKSFVKTIKDGKFELYKE